MDEIRQFRIFAAIAESGNLSAVARQLDSSASLVSRCLAALERRVGVRLAARTTRSLELTEEGRTYYERGQYMELQICPRLRRAHPNELDDRSGYERCSTISKQMRPTPDRHRLYSGLLFERGTPHNAAAGLASLERLARDILRRVSPGMLVVDEGHL